MRKIILTILVLVFSFGTPKVLAFDRSQGYGNARLDSTLINNYNSTTTIIHVGGSQVGSNLSPALSQQALDLQNKLNLLKSRIKLLSPK